MSFLKFWVKSKKKKKDLPPEVLADNGSVFLPGKLPEGLAYNGTDFLLGKSPDNETDGGRPFAEKAF